MSILIKFFKFKSLVIINSVYYKLYVFRVLTKNIIKIKL